MQWQGVLVSTTGINKMRRAILGSETAKGGFDNEHDIAVKFSNWRDDKIAREWLKSMGYEPTNIKLLKSVHIPPHISKETACKLGISNDKFAESIKFKKSDIQIRLEILINDVLYIENISCKKSNVNAGYNQIDKRSVDTYQNMWGFDDTISKWLKLFTGEFNPKDYLENETLNSLHQQKRMLISEMTESIQKNIITFFTRKKMLVLCDILQGRGGLSADWFLVTRSNDKKIDWVLSDINNVIDIFSEGEVRLSPRGSLKIGKITMQRKGGTPDPTSLQFKINPLELFKVAK